MAAVDKIYFALELNNGKLLSVLSDWVGFEVHRFVESSFVIF